MKPEIVINFSGGKDSSAMLAFICENYPDHKKHVVMADTGWEHPDAIQWSQHIVARFNLPLHVVRNPNKTFLSMVESRGMFPAPAQRQCTSDLKRGPIQTWIRRNCGSLIVNAMGHRAEESPARAKMKKLFRSSMSNTIRTVFDWRPILHWPESRVRQYLKEKEIPLHPVYNHLRRFSCRVCIYMSKHDLRQVQKHDPEAIEIIHQLEKKTGFTMRMDGGIKEAVA